MKIVCQSCGTKYSIPDEKVAGKVFKIRCKKCSEVMMVRGDQPSPDPGGTSVSGPPAGEGVWHVIVAGEQQGPMTALQIAELLSAATIDWEAYAWREGFEGWVPLRDIEPLVAEITGQQPQAAAVSDAPADLGADPFAEPGPQPTPAPSSAGFGTPSEPPTRAMPMSPASGGGLFPAEPAPFAEAAAPQAAVASRAASPRGADLFANAAGDAAAGYASAPEEDEGVVASGGGPRVSGQQAMTGARNENSVLFSLANLQALATGTSGAPPATSSASPSSRPGHAAGEGSGLIDIRALASAQSAASAGPTKSSVDDLLSIGSGAAPFAPTLGAPVLMPAKKESSNKGLIIAIAAVAVLALAAIGGMGVMMWSHSNNVAPVASGPNTTATAVSTIAPATPAVNPAGAQANPAGTATPTTPNGATPTTPEASPAATAQAPQDQGEQAGANHERRPGGSGGRRPHESTGSQAVAQADSTPAPAHPTAAASHPSGGNDSLDHLMDTVLGTPGQSGGAHARSTPTHQADAPAAPSENLPPQPNRDQVLAALRSVQNDVRDCGNGAHGSAPAAITVAGTTGRVTNVNVTGQFAGTPVGSCIARAVRGAHFPRFSQPTFSVNFPYML